MPRKVWTPERDRVLRERYSELGAKGVAALLGLSLFGVKDRTGKLGLVGNRHRGRVWTSERDAVLTRVYPVGGLNAASTALGMNRAAIKNRVHQLGLRAPVRYWTAAEDAVIQEHYALTLTAEDIAARLGRGVPAVRRRAIKLGAGNRKETPVDHAEKVRAEYAAKGARQLARELLGNANPLSVTRIYRLAEKLGVTCPKRFAPEVYDRVRELHSRGMNDRQIAAAMADMIPGKNARERVTAIRSRRLGLPKIEQTPEQFRELGRVTRAKQIAAGVNPRNAAYSRFATRYGLPPDTPPRAVEILLALVSGPKTRTTIEEATGHKPHLIWNALGTSYLGGLARRGMIARSRISANRGPRTVYTLTPAAIDLLSTQKESAQ